MSTDRRVLQFGPTLLCEFATKSENRKYTLVNIFSGRDVLVRNLPGLLQMGFYAELVPDESTPRKIDIDIRFNGDSRAKLQFEMEAMKPGTIAVLLAQLPPMKLPEEGVMAFHASADGYEPVLLIDKRIVLERHEGAGAPQAESQAGVGGDSPPEPRPRRNRRRAVT